MRARGRLVAATVALIVAVPAVGAVVLSVVGDILGVSDVGWLGGQTAFAVVGAWILFRQPHNLVGRIMAGSGSVAVLQAFLWRYAHVAYVTDRPLPFAVAAAWVADWVYVPMLTLFLVLLPLYFPTGALLSPRWRPMARFTIGLAVFVTFYLATVPRTLEDFPTSNPAALEATARFAAVLDTVGGDDILFVPVLLLGLAAVVSVVLRYRRSQGVERLQLKWFVWAIGLFMSYLLVTTLVLDVLLNRPASTLTDVIGLLFMLCVPISIGIAVLRYRLYEIDRIISRTVSWGLVTVVVALLYLGLVTALSSATASITGQSTLAVAGSTLAVAAAFGSIRRRIQTAVDRRFNRARYSATATVDLYRTRLRDELDLDGISADLERAVDVTLQPSRVTLWLRPPEVRI